MTIDEARAAIAEAVGHAHLDLGPRRVWKESRFTDGWLLVAVHENPLEETGGYHFVVLDSGEVHLETGSMPPMVYVQKYSRAGSDLTLTLGDGTVQTPDGF